MTFLVILLIEKKVAFSINSLKHTKQMGLLFQEKINTAGESFYSSFHYCVKGGYLLVFSDALYTALASTVKTTSSNACFLLLCSLRKGQAVCLL